MSRRFGLKFLLLFLLSFTVLFSQNDPLNSPMWKDVAKMFFKKEAYVFDNKNIIIKVPSFADNPLQVPIFVDASYYKDAKRLLLFADLNAIIPIIDMNLYDFKAIVSLNMKIAQGTPLRAAVQDKNGLWHVASIEIKSFGGGCSVASDASSMDDWENQLGKHKIKVFSFEKRDRIKLSIFHPMETGFFIENPDFFINSIKIFQNNKELANLKMFASVSENPRFIFESRKTKGKYSFEIKDTDGNEFIVHSKENK